VFLAISYLIFLLLEPLLQWLQTLTPQDAPPPQIQPPDFQRQLEEMSRDTTPVSLTIGGMAALDRLAGLILPDRGDLCPGAAALPKGAGEEIDETRETILSRDLLQAQLSALWRNWRDRFRHTPERVIEPFSVAGGRGRCPARGAGHLPGAAGGAAKARGLPRLRGQTPLEYQRTLAEALPGAQDALSTITSGYQRARYAPQPPPDGAGGMGAPSAWDRLRTALEPQDDDSRDHRRALKILDAPHTRRHFHFPAVPAIIASKPRLETGCPRPSSSPQIPKDQLCLSSTQDCVALLDLLTLAIGMAGPCATLILSRWRQLRVSSESRGG